MTAVGWRLVAALGLALATGAGCAGDGGKGGNGGGGGATGGGADGGALTDTEGGGETDGEKRGGDAAGDAGALDDAGGAGRADGGATDGAGAADGAGPDVPRPPLLATCESCHDLDALATPAEGAALSPREWATLAGDGLVRREPAIPEPGIHLTLPWPRRGTHVPGSPGGCAPCHPVDALGIGHGIRAYPQPELAFAPGTSCAGGCHYWLPGPVTLHGFEGAQGMLTLQVSMRPEALLNGAHNAHADLWRQGAHPPAAAGLRVGIFNPGCGGCHNLASESHGAVLGCLDCHDFEGKTGTLHTAHVALIEDHMEDNDVDMAAMGAGPCGYCHTDIEPSPRAAAACYNCHLSAHQPLDDAGQAQFWPVDP